MINPFTKEGKAQKALEEEIADVRSIIKTSAGRSFIHRMLLASNVFTPVLSKEANEICYYAGLKEYPLRLLGIMLSHSPKEYAKMIEENTLLTYNEEL